NDLAESVDYGVTASANSVEVGPKFLRITDIQNGNVDWSGVPYCVCEDGERVAARLKAGDIVFARTGATTGKSYLIDKCPEDAVFASYLIRVRLGSGADSKFVSHFFDTPDYWGQISKGARGAAQPGVNATTLRALQVPLPPIEEQRRIAAILDKANELRAQRKEALALLDSMAQSIFVDMFGKPEKPAAGVEVVPLAQLCHRITDGTHQSPEWSDSGVPFLFVSNIVSGEIDFETKKFINDATHHELTRRCPIECGDVLYSTVGSYGVPAVVRESRKFAFQRHIAHLKPNLSLLDPEYLCAMLASPSLKRQADQVARGVAQKTINLSEIGKYIVLKASMPMQQQFSNIIRK
ncbi:restriction endonuclease subunit S, partial [Burkholderia sp. E168m23]